jgi:hypothetical protein
VFDIQELLAVRLEAMNAVYREDIEFFTRTICRWYSQHFNTPLHEVGTPNGKVPLEDVMQTFYEVRYKEMDDQKREDEVHLLVRSPEEEITARLAEDIAEAENWGFARMVERNEILKQTRALEAAKQEKLEDAKVQAPDGDGGRVLVNRPIPEVNLDKLFPVKRPPPQKPVVPAITQKHPAIETKMPEGEKIVFMTEEEMEMDAQDPFSIDKAPPLRRNKGKGQSSK